MVILLSNYPLADGGQNNAAKSTPNKLHQKANARSVPPQAGTAIKPAAARGLEHIFVAMWQVSSRPGNLCVSAPGQSRK
jgi:hypothetical protein